MPGSLAARNDLDSYALRVDRGSPNSAVPVAQGWLAEQAPAPGGSARGGTLPWSWAAGLGLVALQEQCPGSDSCRSRGKRGVGTRRRPSGRAEVRWGQASGPTATRLPQPCPDPLVLAGSHPLTLPYSLSLPRTYRALPIPPELSERGLLPSTDCLLLRGGPALWA